MGTWSRRAWIQSVGTASLAGMAATSGVYPASLLASPSVKPGDSLAMQLYKSLSDTQKQAICLPADHPSRKFVSNWWYIHPEHRIPSTFNQEQQELVRAIFDAMHSDEYRDAVNQQVLLDQYGETENAPAAGFFGTPDDDDFEFLFTGHHVTRRCNVHTDQGQGFGGNPIFYGHYPHPETDMRSNFNEPKDHPGNPYWYQGKLFNRWVQALDAKQQKQGLIAAEPRSENPNAVIKTADAPKGLPSSELSADQKKLLADTMREMLAMFRKGDVDATMTTMQERNVLEALTISWYPGKFDIGSDRVWDTWQIEGPDLVWYFRGYPHIHCYFHLKA